jgi:hypothetical protein
MPNLDRQFTWMDPEKIWRYTQKFPFSAGIPNNDKAMKNMPSESEHMKMLVDFTISWNLFEEYCKTIGTKLLWTSWDFEENPNLTFFNQHSSFFSLNMGNFEACVKSHRPDGKLEHDDMNRRDGHSGKLFHMFWKESFEKEISNRGLFDDWKAF